MENELRKEGARHQPTGKDRRLLAERTGASLAEGICAAWYV